MSSSEDEYDVRKSKAKKTKEKPRIVDIPFEEAVAELEKVQRLLANADDGSSSSSSARRRRADVTPPKVKVKISWPDVCASVEKQAGLHGLSREMMEIIWEIVKHPASPAVIGVKLQLLVCMMPIDEYVHLDIIEKVIYSIGNSNDKPGAEKIKLTLIKYLIGLYEYNLLDKNIFNNHLFYGLIFHAHRHDTLVPWVCHFIKKITKREMIRRNYILDLLDLMVTPLNGIAIRSVGSLLRQYKLLRPDLLPNNVFKFNAAGESKKIELSPTMRKHLFEAKSRLLGIGKSLLHIPNFEDDMENDDEEPVPGKGHILSVLNANCFPEFKLYMDGDFDDVRMWIDLHKRDFMRCALKTRDTLPLLVRDPAALEEFNTYVSLVFQHKFESHDVKDKKRYKFILQRCIEVSILQGMGLPAVNEWLLDFLLTWDGVLFKSQLMELLPYLDPIDFADGYMYILLKLERIFLDGEDFDRIQIWRILEGLFIGWAAELLNNDEVNLEVVVNNRKSLELFFDFINALVCKYASIDGHKDDIFLVCACESYIKFSEAFDEIKLIPFYVLPPTALWYMIILSDSIVALNSFCKFAAKIAPVPMKHLRKTSKHAAFVTWAKGIWPEVERYFGYNPEGKLLFRDLFEDEIVVMSHVGRNEENKYSAEVREHCIKYASVLMKNCRALEAPNSRAMSLIMKDVKSKNRLGQNINVDKATKLAPAVLELINFFENQFLLHESGLNLMESFLD